jgi:hypothetical protein
MDSQTLTVIICLAAALAIGWLVYQEQLARPLRTRVVELPGCLRFEAQSFQVEMQQASKQIKVHAENGDLSQTALAGGSKQVQAGALDVNFAAAGLQIEVVRELFTTPGHAAPMGTGYCTINFTASDALAHAVKKLPGGYESTLRISQVPEPVAKDFQSMANRVNLWAEKITRRLEQDRQEQIRNEEELAKAELEKQLAAEKAAKDPGAAEEHHDDFTSQIAHWRETAGFSGAFSEVSTNDQGKVVWFIDLTNDGRITLHANKRTVHTTLRGAKIVSLGSELEVSVRDDYWTEEEPTLSRFQILQGIPPNERRTWKDRLERARDAFDGKADRGY